MQVWCSEVQEQTVLKVMQELCCRVETHYWLKVDQERKEEFKPMQYVTNDVMVGYVGYTKEKSKVELKAVDVRQRSRVVIAPVVDGTSGFVAKEFFEKHSKMGDLVLDAMSRTGQNAVAAASLGRHSISMDIAERQVCIAFRLSGTKAKVFDVAVYIRYWQHRSDCRSYRTRWRRK
jgi:hypothetical protein